MSFPRANKKTLNRVYDCSINKLLEALSFLKILYLKQVVCNISLVIQPESSGKLNTLPCLIVGRDSVISRVDVFPQKIEGARFIK